MRAGGEAGVEGEGPGKILNVEWRWSMHQIRPQVEMYPMSKINDAFDHLKSGKARYRIVLSNV